MVDQHGAPFLGAVRATLGVEMSQDSLAGPSAHIARGGEIVFDPVGLRVRLRLTAFSVGAASWSSKPTSFDGPTEPGQEVGTESCVANPEATLVGRALDASGSPIAHAAFATAECDDEDDCEHRYLRGGRATDGEGGFTATGTAPFGTSDCPTLRVVMPALGLGADVELPSCAAATTADVGDVRFAPSPLIVAGVVEDERGVPVMGARVILLVPIDAVNSSEGWEAIELRTAITASDGTFAIRGVERSDSLGLRVIAAGFAKTEVVPIARGATDVRIVLREAFLLRGRVVTPCSAALARLAVGTTSTEYPSGRIGSLH